MMSMGAAALPVARLAPAIVPPLRIALYDCALPQARTLARYAAQAAIPSLVLQDDIGILWHAQIAAHIREPAIAVCALRASDCFVIERLATRRGIAVIDMENFGDPN